MGTYKTHTETPDTLPHTLWELLAVAKADAIAVAQDSRYTLAMGAWHIPTDSGCRVCLAGAVMARSLHAPRDLNINPGKYGGALDGKLSAINSVRMGAYDTALLEFYPALDQDDPEIKLLRARIELLTDRPHLRGGTSVTDIEEFFDHPKMVKFLAILKEHNL